MEEYCDKRWRADYQGIQVKFLEKLKSISIYLKQIEHSARLPVLINMQNELNKWMQKHVRDKMEHIQSDVKYLFTGIMLPFDQGSYEDPYLVVNILS